MLPISSSSSEHIEKLRIFGLHGEKAEDGGGVGMGG